MLFPIASLVCIYFSTKYTLLCRISFYPFSSCKLIYVCFFLFSIHLTGCSIEAISTQITYYYKVFFPYQFILKFFSFKFCVHFILIITKVWIRQEVLNLVYAYSHFLFLQYSLENLYIRLFNLTSVKSKTDDWFQLFCFQILNQNLKHRISLH